MAASTASSSITLRKNVVLAVTCVQMMKPMTAAVVKGTTRRAASQDRSRMRSVVFRHRNVAPFTGAFVIGFIIWTHVTASTTFFLNVIELLAILAVIAAAWLVYAGRDGWAFTATAVTIAACIQAIFVDLYPNLMVSSTSPAYNLTVHNAASPPYSLKAMTVVVVIFLPLVLLYQAWTYYVFRKRVSASDFAPPPAAAPEPEPRPAAPPAALPEAR